VDCVGQFRIAIAEIGPFMIHEVVLGLSPVEW
jgi:hypothetical protein